MYLCLEWEEAELQRAQKKSGATITVTDDKLERVSLKEYVLTGKYMQLAKAYVENRVKELTGAIGQTLAYMHNFGVILRDLDVAKITIS